MELKERRIIAPTNLFLIYKLKIKFSKHTHMTFSYYFSQIIYRTYRGTFFSLIFTSKCTKLFVIFSQKYYSNTKFREKQSKSIFGKIWDKMKEIH